MGFKIRESDGQIFQRWALADGNGEVNRPFKSEWSTVKDGLLWVGSVGKEWVRLDGTIAGQNSMWVKTIDRNGRIENYDWRPVWQTLREATNTSWPGYLWHEAVVWDELLQKWIFLPRKASYSMYTPVDDQYKGTNLLITTAEDFTDIQVQRLG